MKLSHFSKDPLYSDTLVYWYEQWKSCSQRVKDGYIGIDIINIRVVLLDLLNQYELNKFESENNRLVYLNLIKNFIGEKHLKLYQDELLILKEALEKKESQKVYIIAKELSQKISGETFAAIIFDELFEIITKKLFSREDRNNIRYLTKHIIIELVTSGRDIDDIKKLLKDVFETYYKTEEETYISYKYVPEDLSTDEAVKFIDTLTLNDRLEVFRNNLYPIEKKYTFIFPIWGLIIHLKNEKETFLGLNLYNPLLEKRFPEYTWFDETFNLTLDKENTENNNISQCNIIIKIYAISNNVAKSLATEKYLLFLNLINLEFGSKYKEFYWDGQYKAIQPEKEFGFASSIGPNKDTKLVRRNISKTSPTYFGEEQYNSIQEYFKVMSFLQKNNMFIELNTINNVIELIAKSKWETEENKLLNYWICLESLSDIAKKSKENKFTFIKETITNIYFLWERYRPLHDLFHLTQHFALYNTSDDSINIPNEFLEDVGIYAIQKGESEVSLINFYNRMDELSSYVTKESYLDIIEDTLEFYTKNKTSLDLLRSKRDEVKLTIDYIYKTRNQIVHNGYVAKNLIPYLVNYAEAYANSLFHRIIEVYLKGEVSLQNYFIKEQYESTLLEKKLASKVFYKIELEE